MADKPADVNPVEAEVKVTRDKSGNDICNCNRPPMISVMEGEEAVDTIKYQIFCVLDSNLHNRKCLSFIVTLQFSFFFLSFFLSFHRK